MANHKGFTLIELLIVVVVIGILAAVAIPRFNAIRADAHFSAMKADLRNLQAQQEVYYSGLDATASPPQPRFTYATSVNEAALGFTASDGVKVDITAGANSAGWSATATHAAFNYSTDKSCVVYVGGAAPLPPATTPDVVACKGER